MTFGEASGVAVLLVLAYGGFIALLFYWSKRV